uniref:hypothetical protein n=1 Tax=Neorhizobium sp. EC2-8 TaxID=3129230 RepID=UPI003101AECD
MLLLPLAFCDINHRAGNPIERLLIVREGQDEQDDYFPTIGSDQAYFLFEPFGSGFGGEDQVRKEVASRWKEVADRFKDSFPRPAWHSPPPWPSGSE